MNLIDGVPKGNFKGGEFKFSNYVETGILAESVLFAQENKLFYLKRWRSSMSKCGQVVLEGVVVTVCIHHAYLYIYIYTHTYAHIYSTPNDLARLDKYWKT